MRRVSRVVRIVQTALADLILPVGRPAKGDKRYRRRLDASYGKVPKERVNAQVLCHSIDALRSQRALVERQGRARACCGGDRGLVGRHDGGTMERGGEGYRPIGEILILGCHWVAM